MQRKLIGYCGVDSGQILLTDPCYLDKFKNDEFVPNDPKNNNFSYSGACYATMSDDKGGQLKNDKGIDIAVAVSTGIGDGSYPVYAEYEDTGKGTGREDIRVKRVIIEFLN